MKKKLFTLLLALFAIATTAQAQNTNGHEYVDLGLPSGTLWATCNVGATKPEEPGIHFAWGETTTKESYTWDNYKWCNGSAYRLTKYTRSDGKTELDLQDDAAYANWGGNWRMPSTSQIIELINKCDWEWTQLNGVNGRKATSKINGKSIFLPAAGWRGAQTLYGAGSSGSYLSRSLNTNDWSGSYGLLFSSSFVDWGLDLREHGQSVRPVMMKKQDTGLLLNAENFPDANFRAALASILKISEGKEISAEKIAATTNLNVSSKSISDLTGIEHFTALTTLWCFVNQIKGEAMDALVKSLPTVSKGELFVIDTKNPKEGNVCTKAQVAFAKAKGWTVYDYNGSWGNRQEYEGSGDAVEGLVLNAENFPDANFRKALAEILRISEGDEITEAKIAATTSLDVGGKTIADLTGIEHFTALTELHTDYNQLTVLDVSQNTALNQLWCSGNQLTSLDVSQNIALTSLHCNRNQLTSLDVSQNTALSYLQCLDNQLTSLDVSQNVALTQLACWQNQLTSLDLSKNTELILLDCSGNQLTSLDVSKNTSLTRLDCHHNQLTALDVSQNTALDTLACNNNQLTSLDISKCTALTGLRCESNQLTALDVSKNTALEILLCNNNQLTALDVSKNILVQTLYCYKNKITSLDVSKNTALTNLVCYRNELTSLNVLKNTKLKQLVCFSNKIKNAEMDALVNSLPTVENGEFYVINTQNENEGNVCTKAQVGIAKEKGWTVYDNNGGSKQEYEGSDEVEQEINPVDENDNVDFGSDMDENDDLNGTVIRDIYYNIGDGKGEYNADEGCIVLKKTTDDETVDGLSGKDIFGEDFKGQFTGIVFKVPAGKGTVKVTAETTGNMLLKVKIGDGEPVEMELNGKLKISFPYNVSETTLVAIYAGANNEAKGFGTTNATDDAALKIYGIEFERDNTTAINNSQFTIDNSADSWYTIDGVKLNGEPTQKGVYIVNGKKVVK